MVARVAIVGSGPAGFYTANALIKKCDSCEIDIVERLPTPYGLIRGGVAPDHQTTKRVAKKFEKIALAKEVRYYGNVEINNHVSLSELRKLYDAVVLAVGAPLDRKLEIPGEEKSGVYGSAAFVGWYNGHPDFHALNPCLNSNCVVVIGNGNVALDCARVLLRTRDTLAATDIPQNVQASIANSMITDVFILGRRGPIEASFTNIELRELGHLTEAEPRVHERQLEVGSEKALASYQGRERRIRQRNLRTLTEFAELPPETKQKRLHFQFFSRPDEVLGGGRVEAVRFERTCLLDGKVKGTGDFFEIPCGLVISAIGYRGERINGVPYDEMQSIVLNHEGRVAPGVYVVGWIKRGPTGVISSNRLDGEVVANHIFEDIIRYDNSQKLGRKGLEKHLQNIGHRWVSFREWQYLDSLEKSSAGANSPRRKFLSIEAMLDALETVGENNKDG